MNESKIELTERLRREGRWGEASRFKDAAVKDFHGKGMPRSEAGEAAWEAMAEAYPPLEPPEALSDAPGDCEGHDEPDDELIDVDALVAKQPHDFNRDVQWVYTHLADRNVKPEDAPTANGSPRCSRETTHDAAERYRLTCRSAEAKGLGTPADFAVFCP